MPIKEQLSLSVVERINRRALESHALKEYRPMVVALIVNDNDGSLLLAQSSKDPADWGCPQSRIGVKETVTMALVRELREGISLLPMHFDIDAYLGEETLAFEGERGNKRGFSLGEHYFLFSVVCTRPEVILVDPAEFSTVRWVFPRDLAKALATARPDKREMLLRYLRKVS